VAPASGFAAPPDGFAAPSSRFAPGLQPREVSVSAMDFGLVGVGVLASPFGDPGGGRRVVSVLTGWCCGGVGVVADRMGGRSRVP
jgi:hypothetical protein